MAGLRAGRPSCIRAAFGAASTRAGFRRRQRNALHLLKVNHRKNHVDFVEGIWRELLDPYPGVEDIPAHLACSFKDCSPSATTCHPPSHTPTPRSPEAHSGPLSPETPALVVVRATGGNPASPGFNDVDMQPAEMTEEDWGPLLPAVEPPETGHRVQGRARASRLTPRLGSERDKAPRLVLSKRKLELLLSEPEKRKRRKPYVA